jgi:hypothetical protein
MTRIAGNPASGPPSGGYVGLRPGVLVEISALAVLGAA